MHLDEYVLILTLGAIRAPDPGAPAEIERRIGKQYELREPCRLGRFSFAGVSEGRLLGWLPWVEKARESREPCHLAAVTPELPPGLPPLQAQGFAVPRWALRLGDQQFLLGSRFSSPVLLQPAEFAQLLAAQPAREAVIGAVAAALSENRMLNDRPAIPPEKLLEHLASPEALDDASLLFDLVGRAQRAARGAGSDLVIPSSLADRFVRAEPSPYNDEAAELTIDALSLPEYLALVEAQPNPEAVWEQQSLAWAVQSGGEALGPREVEARLRAMSEEDFACLPVGDLLQAVAAAAPGAFVITPALQGRLLTRAEEYRRSFGAEYVPQRERWEAVPMPNELSWSCLLFASEPPTAVVPPPDPASTRQSYLSALLELGAYAHRIDSPFQEAFALAAALLDAGAPAGSAPAAWASWGESRGFSRRALSVLEGAIGLLDDVAPFAWPAEKCQAVLSLDVADVFGDMGSWNDQALDEEGECLSNALLAARASFFLATLDG